MADEFSGIERLLGLPQGSTKKIKPEDVGKKLTTAVNKKANTLSKELKKTDALETMSSADLVKCGLSVESLENDKITIRNEAFEVYRITKALYEKYYNDVKDMVDVNDRMYTAGFKGADSIVNTLDKLTNIILRFKQDEEMKQLSILGDDDDGKKDMHPTQWMDFVDHVKENEDEDENVKDAEIVEVDDTEDDK